MGLVKLTSCTALVGGAARRRVMLHAPPIYVVEGTMHESIESQMTELSPKCLCMLEHGGCWLGLLHVFQQSMAMWYSL
jgi:hypothetical protein